MKLPQLLYSEKKTQAELPIVSEVVSTDEDKIKKIITDNRRLDADHIEIQIFRLANNSFRVNLKRRSKFGPSIYGSYFVTRLVDDSFSFLPKIS